MSDFKLPFPLESVTSFFGPRQVTAESRELVSPWSPTPPLEDVVWEDHEGFDFGQPGGTPVVCPADGVVSRVTDDDDSEGYAVYVSHGEHNAVLSVVAHLSGRPDLVEGQSVTQGQVIGYVGDSGNSTGPHLHFGVLIKGIAYNPLSVQSNWSYFLSVDWDSTEKKETNASDNR